MSRYLQSQGYRTLPVNLRGGELFGELVFRSLSKIDVPVDMGRGIAYGPGSIRYRQAGHCDRGEGALASSEIESEEAPQKVEVAWSTVCMNCCM